MGSGTSASLGRKLPGMEWVSSKQLSGCTSAIFDVSLF